MYEIIRILLDGSASITLKRDIHNHHAIIVGVHHRGNQYIASSRIFFDEAKEMTAEDIKQGLDVAFRNIAHEILTTQKELAEALSNAT